MLVAGMGNVLRGDDGYGSAVLALLAEQPAPEGVVLRDIGIGGIHLVHELLDPTDVLVVVDAAELRRPPGTVAVLRPEVLDVTAMSMQERHDQLADMHYATPARALMLARGMTVLPDAHWIVGCQPVDASTLGEGLSEPVAGAVATGAEEVRRIAREAGIAWPSAVDHAL